MTHYSDTFVAFRARASPLLPGCDMAGKNSALDDLMLACSDLSGPGKRQGFKGPPVKDIRREAPKQVFQPSQKARDWRAFDQNLESVFGSSSSSSGAPPPQPHLLPPQVTSAPPPNPAPVQMSPLQPVFGSGPSQNQNQGQGDGDDWGDFQAFSTSSSVVPSSSSTANQSIGCR